ncbi:uncharacterized protein [Diadema antillarum]|uniref:uncharacterized protein n=1 Tax=Diadema antillarum TaxID=105358 RepID=UPI003A8AD050
MLVTHITAIAYQVVLFVIGVPGNALIILTYGKRRSQSGNCVFLVALALADIGVCLMAPVVIVHYVYYYNSPGNVFCKFRYYTNHGLIYVSRFLTIAVAVERYLAVCKPFSKRLGPRGAAIVALICVPLGYTMTIPIALAFRIRDLPGNRTICYPDTSEPAIFYSLRVTFPIVYLVGLAVVVACYGMIFKVVREQLVIRAKLFGDGAMSSANRTLGTQSVSEIKLSNSHHETSFTNVQEVDVEQGKSTKDVHLSVVAPASIPSTTDKFVNDVPPSTATDPLSQKLKIQGNEESVKGPPENSEGEESSKQVKQKKKTTSKAPSIDSTTKMLLIVTVIYFLSSAPQLITLAIPSAMMAEFQRYHYELYQVFVFVRSMITINHIVNPIVYGFINERFRRDCLAALRGIKKSLCRN